MSRRQTFLIPTTTTVREYEPLKHPELPLEFGNLWTQGGYSPDQLLKFANNWGELGGNIAVTFIPIATGGSMQTLDKLENLNPEISGVARVTKIAALGVLKPNLDPRQSSEKRAEQAIKIAEVKSEQLSSYTAIHTDVAFWRDEFGGINFDRKRYPVIWDGLGGDTFEARVLMARLVIKDELTRGMKNRFEYKPVWDGLTLKTTVVPVGLIGAIWYLLSEQIFQGNGYRLCTHCNRIFYAKHFDKMTCRTDTCKSRVRRQNRKNEVVTT